VEEGAFIVWLLLSCKGSLLAAIFLVCTGYVGCNREAVIALVAAAVGAIGIATSSYVVNHLDLAAPFAGSSERVCDCKRLRIFAG
jgi:hypothetical protein